MKAIHYLLIFHLIVGILTLLYFDGTGDSGDSIYHYLYAKYAPINNSLYFDHWAKPFYVLIASPFSQLGFIGVKIMNLIFVNATLYLTYVISKNLNVANAWLAPLFLIFSPLYFILTFSGLTEPLFAFLLSLSIYFFFNKKFFWSCLVVSILPFVRSEGLLFMGIFGAYLLYFKKWKAFLLLFSGSIIYSFAGYPYYDDLLWVFNKVPYAKLSSTYGSGDPFHFIEQLQYVIGIPLYILFWIGILRWFIDLFNRKTNINSTYFIYGSVFVFLLAHSTFWYLGVFNSMGLKRVIICILPLIAIIALKGFNLIYELNVRDSIQKVLGFLILTYVIVFPFTSNPAAIDLKYDLSFNLDQKLAHKVAHQIDEQLDHQYNRVFTNHPYMCEALDINCFDKEQKMFLSKSTMNEFESKDILIWDSWFSVVEQGLKKEVLENEPRLNKIYQVSEKNHKGRTIEYILYVVK